MSLYDELGVDQDAAPDEIKRAYRRAAQRHHPDKPQGNAERFHAIQTAYDVLLNPARRARYDKTGQSSFEDPRQAAIGAVIHLVLSAIDALDEERVDIIKMCRENVAQAQAKDLDEITKIERSILKRKRAAKRLRAKSGPNFLVRMIESDIATRKEVIEQGKENLRRHDAVLAVLADYEYDVEALEQLVAFRVGSTFI